MKNDRFIALANDLAKQVAMKNPADVEELLAQPFVDEPATTMQDRFADVVGLIRENMRPARFARVERHHRRVRPSRRHASACCSHVSRAKARRRRAAARHLHAHRGAAAAVSRRPTELPADVVEREKAFAKQQADEQAAGKPANIIEKIAEGKFKTWLAENVLVDQPMANQIKYGKKTVGELLEGRQARSRSNSSATRSARRTKR